MAEILDQMITTWMDDHGSDDWQDDIKLDALDQMLDTYMQSPELQEIFFFTEFYGWEYENEDHRLFIKVGNIHKIHARQTAHLQCGCVNCMKAESLAFSQENFHRTHQFHSPAM